MKLRKNDEVIVIAGKEKGKTGKITKILSSSNSALVAGVNIVKKHIKPSQTNPDGGIQDKEAPIHLSNLSYYVRGKKGGASKLGYKFETKDKKRIKKRVVKRTGGTI